MNFVTILCFFIVLIATVSTRHVQPITSNNEEDLVVIRVRRGKYGCGVLSSNNKECGWNCQNIFGCYKGKCEGTLKRLCRCRNEDDSFC